MWLRWRFPVRSWPGTTVTCCTFVFRAYRINWKSARTNSWCTEITPAIPEIPGEHAWPSINAHSSWRPARPDPLYWAERRSSGPKRAIDLPEPGTAGAVNRAARWSLAPRAPLQSGNQPYSALKSVMVRQKTGSHEHSQGPPRTRPSALQAAAAGSAHGLAACCCLLLHRRGLPEAGEHETRGSGPARPDLRLSGD